VWLSQPHPGEELLQPHVSGREDCQSMCWKVRVTCSRNPYKASRPVRPSLKGSRILRVLFLRKRYSASGDTFQIVLTCSDDQEMSVRPKSLSCCLSLHLQDAESIHAVTECSSTDRKTAQASCVPSRPSNLPDGRYWPSDWYTRQA
jgi:hypothetical protein